VSPPPLLLTHNVLVWPTAACRLLHQGHGCLPRRSNPLEQRGGIRTRRRYRIPRGISDDTRSIRKNVYEIF
ncbi:hypothetical protein PENTCL1PPCAC_13067, partial [Pristionchus entomophagus]